MVKKWSFINDNMEIEGFFKDYKKELYEKIGEILSKIEKKTENRRIFNGLKVFLKIRIEKASNEKLDFNKIFEEI